MVEIAGVQNEGVLRPLPPRWPAVLRDCDLLELAKSAASCMSARYCRMYEGTYYDDRRYNWDGDIEETTFGAYGVATNHAFAPNEQAGFIPNSQRRPVATKQVAKAIVDQYTRFVMSGDRFPSIQILGDSNAQDYVRQIAKEAKLASKMREARTVGGACGSVAISYAYVRGKPRVSVHRPYNCWVLGWADRDELEPATVVECYPTRKIVLSGQAKTPQKTWLYFVRVWTQTECIVWDEMPKSALEEVREDETRSWLDMPHKRVFHGMGRCPVLWVQNIPRSDRPEGDSDYQGLLADLEDVDYLTSSTSRGARLNVDPTLILKVAPGQKSNVRVGSDHSIWVGPDGDAKYLELEGKSVSSSKDWSAERMNDISHVTGAVFADPETLSGRSQSAAAMRLLYQPQLAQADNLREQYGDRAIIPLLKELLRAARRINANEGGTGVRRAEGGRLIESLPTVELDPKPELDEDGQLVAMVPRDPGVADHVSLVWPPYFHPTPTDKKLEVEAASLATSKKAVLSVETAVRSVSPLFGEDDGDEEYDRLEQQQAEDLAVMQLGGPQPPGEAEPSMSRGELWGDESPRGTSDGATGEGDSGEGEGR